MLGALLDVALVVAVLSLLRRRKSDYKGEYIAPRETGILPSCWIIRSMKEAARGRGN